MRKLLLNVGLLLLLATLLAACGGSDQGASAESSSASADNDKVYEINWNISAAPTSAFTKEIAEPFADYVEEKTDGRIKINLFTSAALGSLDTALEDIQNRVYEFGLVSPARQTDSELFPLTIADIPFTIISPQVAVDVLTEYIAEFMDEETGFGNAVFISASTTDTINQYSKVPLETADALKGKNISDSAPTRLDLIQHWGASPVYLANTEIYEGLERGTIDASHYTTVGADGFHLYEVAPYLNKIDMGVITQILLMNKDFFNSLPEDIQELFKGEFAEEYARLVVESYTNKYEYAIENFAAQGGTVVEPDESVMDALRSAVPEIAEGWIKTANDKGYDGAAMVEFYSKALEANGVVSPFK